VWLWRLWKSVHEILSFKGSQKDTYRWEAVHLHMGGMHMEVCTVWWADSSLSQTHRTEAF
jgi:hypothetical protein